MGAYVSREYCESRGVTLSCEHDLGNGTSQGPETVGGFERGGFPANPDIAGIGVLGAFLVVTVVALIFSVLSTIWWLMKNVLAWKKRHHEEVRAELKATSISFSGFLESFVTTCSDQQIFTGCAYAVTLRYVTGCSISAYHYDVVANMLLITCATHLVAVTVARNYWDNPLPSLVRIAVTAVLYIVTGVLLSNQGSDSKSFPTVVPPDAEKYSDLLLPAACFQSGQSGLSASVKEFTSSGLGFLSGSRIPGFPQYVIMFLCYGVAVVVRLASFVRSGKDEEKGHRKQLAVWFRGKFRWLFRPGPQWFLRFLFGAYLVLGNVVGIWTVATSAWYIVRMRNWVGKSGWLELAINGMNPEDDAASFGQLVPIFLNLMLLFAILQFISERMRDLDAKKKKKHEMEAARKKRDSPDLAEKGSASDTKKSDVQSDAKSLEIRPSIKKSDTNDSQADSDTKKADVQVKVRPAPVDIEVDLVTPAADEKKTGILIDTEK